MATTQPPSPTPFQIKETFSPYCRKISSLTLLACSIALGLGAILAQLCGASAAVVGSLAGCSVAPLIAIAVVHCIHLRQTKKNPAHSPEEPPTPTSEPTPQQRQTSFVDVYVPPPRSGVDSSASESDSDDENMFDPHPFRAKNAILFAALHKSNTDSAEAVPITLENPARPKDILKEIQQTFMRKLLGGREAVLGKGEHVPAAATLEETIVLYDTLKKEVKTLNLDLNNFSEQIQSLRNRQLELLKREQNLDYGNSFEALAKAYEQISALYEESMQEKIKAELENRQWKLLCTQLHKLETKNHPKNLTNTYQIACKLCDRHNLQAMRLRLDKEMTSLRQILSRINSFETLCSGYPAACQLNIDWASKALNQDFLMLQLQLLTIKIKKMPNIHTSCYAARAAYKQAIKAANSFGLTKTADWFKKLGSAATKTLFPLTLQGILSSWMEQESDSRDIATLFQSLRERLQADELYITQQDLELFFREFEKTVNESKICPIEYVQIWKKLLLIVKTNARTPEKFEEIHTLVTSISFHCEIRKDVVPHLMPAYEAAKRSYLLIDESDASLTQAGTIESFLTAQ